MWWMFVLFADKSANIWITAAAQDTEVTTQIAVQVDLFDVVCDDS